MIQRNGSVIIRMLDNVQRTTIDPIIRKFVKAGSTFYTDKYNIYNWLSNIYILNIVNHSKGEYTRDDNGDEKHEVHVNTMEGFWFLLRPWLRWVRLDLIVVF